MFELFSETHPSRLQQSRSKRCEVTFRMTCLICLCRLLHTVWKNDIEWNWEVIDPTPLAWPKEVRTNGWRREVDECDITSDSPVRITLSFRHHSLASSVGMNEFGVFWGIRKGMVRLQRKSGKSDKWCRTMDRRLGYQASIVAIPRKGWDDSGTWYSRNLVWRPYLWTFDAADYDGVLHSSKFMKLQSESSQA